MDIGYYIADLLAVEAEVNLPGVGTFVRTRVPGRLDAMTNTLLPPTYEVGFKHQESEPDLSSLAGLLIRKKNLSRSSAEYFIRKFATATQELLETSGVAEIQPFGTLKKQESEIVFHRTEGYVLAGDSFGLIPVQAPASFRFQPPVEDEAPATAPPPKPGDEVEELIGTLTQDSSGIFGTPILEREEEEEPVEKQVFEDRPRINVLGAVLGGLAAILITVAGFAYFFYPEVKSLFLNEKQQPAAEYAPVDTNVTQAPTAVDTVNQAPLPAPADTIPDTIAAAQATIVTTYEIIGASLARKSDAEAYIKALENRGRKAKIVENVPGRLIKVSIGTFNDEQSAQAELNRLREAGQDVWIQRVTQTKNN